MCTSPLKILPNHLRDLPFAKEIEVPCGHCIECQNKKASEIYVRAKHEYDHCLSNGGNGFMCCLTYGLDLAPSFEIDGKSFYVFNKKHCIDFLKRLRISIERNYKKFYPGQEIPSFKYLITSEFGKSSSGHHLPHYHCLFFFEKPIIPSVFTKCFRQSTIVWSKDRKSFSRVFGRVHQCELIDPGKGGIRYSGKYVCKDIFFEENRKAITDFIKARQYEIDRLFKITKWEKTEQLKFRNHCIRQTKAYKDAVSATISPLRHMLQFYMCSNDFGATAVIHKYGRQFEENSYINIDGFLYSIPRLVKKYYKDEFGEEAFHSLNRKIFQIYFGRAVQWCHTEKIITLEQFNDLSDFVNQYVQPYKGHLVVYRPGVDCPIDSRYLDYDRFCEDMHFYLDNDFLSMLGDVYRVLRSFNSYANCLARDQHQRFQRELENNRNDQRKKNKGYYA